MDGIEGKDNIESMNGVRVGEREPVKRYLRLEVVTCKDLEELFDRNEVKLCGLLQRYWLEEERGLLGLDGC